MSEQEHESVTTQCEISRRKQVRYLFSVPVDLKRVGEGLTISTFGISLEISEGGLSLLSRDPLCIGDHVQIHMALPAGPLQAEAVVLRQTGRHYGLQFTGLTPEQTRLVRESSQTMQIYTSHIFG
jgi:hypothetical protein